MATLLPPPKRQKVYHGVPEPPKEEVKPSRNVVVQFVSEDDDGAPLAPAVNLPSNLNRAALENLVNQLTRKSAVCIAPKPHLDVEMHAYCGRLCE